MTSTGPDRAYRLLLDALGPSPSMVRLRFFSSVAGDGLPNLSPDARRAMQFAIAAEAVQKDGVTVLPFLQRDPALVRRAKSLSGATDLALSGSLSSIAYTDLSKEKLEPHEVVLLVIKYLAQRRFHDAIDLHNAFNDKLPLADAAWYLCSALIAHQAGDQWSCVGRIGKAVETLLSQKEGIWSSNFWTTLDVIGADDAVFNSFIAEQVADKALPLVPYDAALIIIGIAQNAASKAVTIPTEPIERIAHAVELAIANSEVIASIPASICEKALLAVQKLLRPVAAAYRKDLDNLETEDLPTKKTGSAELDRWVNATMRLARTQKSWAQLAFTRGDTYAALQAWNSAAVLEAQIIDEYSTDGKKSDPVFADIYEIASTADLISMKSAMAVSLGAAEPARRNLMSRVDTDPIRRNHGGSSPFCISLERASVIYGDREGSVFWYVKTLEKKLLADGLNVHPRFHYGSVKERMVATSSEAEALISATPSKRTMSSSGTSVLLGGVANYYHWTLEYLPRLLTLQRLIGPEKFSNVRFLVNSNPTSWQLMMLQRANVPLEALVHVPGGFEVTCSRLIVPSIPNASDSIGYLRQVMDIGPRGPTGRRIYVSRLDVHPDRRRIADEEQVAEAFEMAGYEIIIPTEVSFDAQIDAFSQADVIVGAHGAALTNLAYAAPEALVVEITNTQNHNYDFFKEITDVLGIRHLRYRGHSERDTVDAENAAAVIDMDQLLKFIDAKIESAEAPNQ